MEKEVKFIIDNESKSFEVLKNIPAVHRNTFLHLAIVHAVNTEFYKMMVKGDESVTSIEAIQSSSHEKVSAETKTSALSIDWDM